MAFSPSIPVDATFTALGVSAVLDPDGVALGVKIIPSNGAVDAGFEGINVRNPGIMYRIRVSELGSMGKGTIIEVGGVRKKVKSPPKPVDSRGLVLELDTQNVG